MAEHKESAKENLKYIVRIAGKDLNGSLPISRALMGIKGIDHRMARNIAVAFEKEGNAEFDPVIGKLSEEQEKKLEEIALAPHKFGIPLWAMNRKNDYDSGENKHLVMSELDFSIRQDLQRLNEIKSYRGLRHSWGLPVRGQSTRSTHRGKGGVVGVMKKDAKQAAAPAKAAAVPEKGAEKKPAAGGAKKEAKK